jgi:CRISPR-associated protein Cmr2
MVSTDLMKKRESAMKFYLSFAISPVQEFVSAARTTRDLWTGSYLLSWLTGHAIRAVGEKNLILPRIENENPLLRAIGGNPGSGAHEGSMPPELVPIITNTFVARVDDPASAKTCENTVRKAWLEICDAVHSYLNAKLRNKDPRGRWDAFWSEQVKNYWSIQTVVVPIMEAETQERLVPGNFNRFQRGLRYLGRLAAAKKQIRHFPLHEIYKSNNSNSLIEDTRPKCAMFGSMAQMGTIAAFGESQMSLSRQFWEVAVTETKADEARLQRKDRLCAVSLVKRFAWACFFKHKFKYHHLPFPDIDTICAAEWLKRGEIIVDNQHEERSKTDSNDGRKYWSGHWLRWRNREEGREENRLDGCEPCPADSTWKLLEKGKNSIGAVPRYYAAIMLDGDKMGEAINRCEDEKQLERVSAELSRFATVDVSRLIKEALGKLIYAGGDDVLALLPAENALTCANALRESFASLGFPTGNQPTSTVALVVAHYKTPLHTVLAELHTTERIGKSTGGNCLALAVMRRSGETTTNTVDWSQARTLNQFVDWFKDKRLQSESHDIAQKSKGETDRWIYSFRQVLHEIPDDETAIRVELSRLLSRAELREKNFSQTAVELFRDVCSANSTRGEQEIKRTFRDTGETFSKLILAASFIARDGGR